ncbi:MAG: hypothetical protein NUV84_01995 [Candidatus Uhrbacteria bacterium]|nr:hypothetical protein [Candidatus Uhrbacteria bacterium]
MKRVWLFFAGILLLAGCGTVPLSVEPVVDSTSSGSLEVQENWYRNTRFGYVLQVPDGATLYTLTPQQTAVVADEDSDVVFLVDGETNFFTVRGIEDSRTPHEWLTQNLSFFYPTGDAAQRVGEFAGTQAIFLQGSGTASSPARLIVLSLGGTLIVISYEQDTALFESLVGSFSLI